MKEEKKNMTENMKTVSSICVRRVIGDDDVIFLRKERPEGCRRE
jgi:hypothetical protein